jgi:hypothetical protein
MSEFKETILHFGINPSQQQLDLFFIRYDLDVDKLLAQNEFTLALVPNE